jgi:hypothetical protein
MAYEQRDLSGSLFKNDRKESDTHPDYKGSALIGGVDHWLDAWINTDRNGNKYMALKFKPKEARHGNAGGYSGDPATNRSGGIGGGAPAPVDLDDDVPFVSCDPALEARVR